MGRSDILAAVAVILLVGLFVAALAEINQRPDGRAAPTASDAPSAPVPDDLSIELRRCGVLGPRDAEDPHCRAVWEENRRRFFGRPVRSLPPSAAPANPTPGDAR